MRERLIVATALLLLCCSSESPVPADAAAGSAGMATSGTGGSATSAAGGGVGGAGGAGNVAGTAIAGGGSSNAGAGGSPQAGSGGAVSGGGSAGATAFALTSSEHSDGAVFADAFTCAGEGRSPALSWTPGPPGTKSYAITFFDQDLVEQNSPNGYHWVVWDISASTLALPADFPSGATLTSPVAARQVSPQNPFDQLPANTYFGPCPNAIGNTDDEHEYAFTLHALGAETLTGALGSVKDVDTAIQAASPLASAKLTGKSSAKPD